MLGCYEQTLMVSYSVFLRSLFLKVSFFFLFTRYEKQSKTEGEISSFLLCCRAILAPSTTYLCYAEDNLAPSSRVTC